MNIKKEIPLNVNTQFTKTMHNQPTKTMHFIADSAKFDVPKNEYFNKRHSYQILLKFYKNICLIITYNIYKN